MTLEEKADMFRRLDSAYSYLKSAIEQLERVKKFDTDEEERVVKECMKKLQDLAK